MKLCPKCQKQFSDDANFCPVDAARLTPIAANQGGTDPLAARFDLGETLGGGRTGTVRKAIDKQSGKPCVVKLIAPAVVALPGVSQRLERELKQLERVQSVGVAKVVASGKRGDETWVATELLEGAQTLADAITARGPIGIEEAAHLIEVIGEALIEAAQVGVVHRDLAPKNVLFAGSDLKLINFSLPVPTTSKVPGVPEFVAPEQVDGKPVDQRSNLYSLGALYYYILSGQTVHAGSSEEVHRGHTSGQIRPISQLIDVPAAVEAVIMRALDRSPTKRFLTVRQFVDEVNRVARGEDVRSTMPLGRANNRHKGDLVQTLLGVRSGATPAAAPAPAPAAAKPRAPTPPPISPSQTVQGVPALAGSAPSTPASSGPPLAGTMVGVASGAADRSPWAPPGAHPAIADAPNAATAQVPAPPVVPASASVPTAPVVPSAPAAPVVPAAPTAPTVAPAKAAAAAGKKKAQEDKDSKGKFRETMWFKKGELDVQAAERAAEERERTGKDVAGDKADSLPIDERYKDDGSISRSDKEKYSLRTGGTQMMAKVRRGDTGSSDQVSEDELIGEMKGGRNLVFLAIFLIAVGIGVGVYFLVR